MLGHCQFKTKVVVKCELRQLAQRKICPSSESLSVGVCCLGSSCVTLQISAVLIMAGARGSVVG
jgi:hypothetical protein